MSDVDAVNKERSELLQQHLEAVKQLHQLEAQAHRQRAAVIDLEAKLAENHLTRLRSGGAVAGAIAGAAAALGSEGGAMLW